MTSTRGSVASANASANGSAPYFAASAAAFSADREEMPTICTSGSPAKAAACVPPMKPAPRMPTLSIDCLLFQTERAQGLVGDLHRAMHLFHRRPRQPAELDLDTERRRVPFFFEDLEHPPEIDVALADRGEIPLAGAARLSFR